MDFSSINQIREALPKGMMHAQNTFTLHTEKGELISIVMFTTIDGKNPKFFCPSYVMQDRFAGKPMQGRFSLFIEATTLQEAFDKLDAQATDLWENQLKKQMIEQILSCQK